MFLISDQILKCQHRDANANPYHINVGDPRPSFEYGKTVVYSFGVLDKLPTIELPLDNEDKIAVEFGVIYNTTYNERPFWRSGDYEKEPMQIEGFSPTVQEAIRDTMAHIAET